MTTKLKLFFLLVLTASCSNLNWTKKNEATPALEIVQEESQKMCLSGEGRGRINTIKDRQTFKFESYFSEENGTWELFIRGPLTGEQRLFVNLRGGVEGQLDKRVDAALIENGYPDDWRREFFLKLSQLLGFYLKLKTDQKIDCFYDQAPEHGFLLDNLRGHCSLVDPYAQISWKFSEDGIKIYTPFYQEDWLVLEFSDLVKLEAKYQKIKLEVQKRNLVTPVNTIFRMDLIMSSCN